jgi:hypothetical protein
VVVVGVVGVVEVVEVVVVVVVGVMVKRPDVGVLGVLRAKKVPG